MQAEHERVLQNLIVLGSVLQNDKIISNDDCFVLHEPSAMRSLYRYYYSENRIANVCKIQANVREAKGFITSCITSEPMEETNFATRMQATNMRQARSRMMTAMRKSIQGLENLKLSYKEDASTNAKLDMIINEINDFVMATNQSSPALSSDIVPSRPPSPLHLQ